jgi:fucose permease
MCIAGLGNGLEDAAWNAWASNLARHNEVLGILHACYGVGATLAPLIGTAMVTTGGKPWWTYYYVMIGMSVIELALGTYAFWGNSAEAYRLENPRTESESGARNVVKEALWTMPYARTVWLGTAFLFLYLGVEVALGGWIVVFMRNERAGSPFASGMAAVGFWLGMVSNSILSNIPCYHKLGYFTIGGNPFVDLHTPAN